MHEPGLEELPGPVWDLVSPAEIRRRGDSRTRRRRVAAAVACTAVVALAATSVVAVTGLPLSGDVVAGDPSRASSSGEDSGGGRPALAAVDLGSGMRLASATTSQERADPTTLAGITICGGNLWSSRQVEAAPDVEVAAGLDASGTRVRRILLGYRDEDAARDALLSLRRAAAPCSSADDGGERMIALPLGDDPKSWSWAYAFPSGAGLGPSGGRGSLLAARVGTVVLLSQTGDDSSTGGSLEEQLSPDVLRVVHDMCDLAPRSC